MSRVLCLSPLAAPPNSPSPLPSCLSLRSFHSGSDEPPGEERPEWGADKKRERPYPHTTSTQPHNPSHGSLLIRSLHFPPTPSAFTTFIPEEVEVKWNVTTRRGNGREGSVVGSLSCHPFHSPNFRPFPTPRRSCSTRYARSSLRGVVRR